jgi:hypothetical protein
VVRTRGDPFCASLLDELEARGAEMVVDGDRRSIWLLIWPPRRLSRGSSALVKLMRRVCGLHPHVSGLLDLFGNPVRLGLAWPEHHLCLAAAIATPIWRCAWRLPMRSRLSSTPKPRSRVATCGTAAPRRSR